MSGQKRELELKQIERPFIAYSLCFDDVMRTYLCNVQIPYWHAFGACWEFCYDPMKSTEDSVSFPTVGYIESKQTKKKLWDEIEELQLEIFDYRKQAYLIPDWFHRLGHNNRQKEEDNFAESLSKTKR